MKKVLLTTAPKEALVETDGIGGNWYDRTDTYMAWTCAVDLEDRLSVTCPPTGLNFLKANVPDVEVLEYPTWDQYLKALASEDWDMVGISFYTWSVPVAIEMAKVAREAGVQDIWGGNYGAITPGLEKYFTKLVRGPGEYALHQYVYGEPLKRLHHPAMLGESSFRGVASPVGYLYSKRGCNIGCTFCSTPIFNPKEDPIFLEETYDALDRYREEQVAHVIIYDESFFLRNELAERIIDALAERELPRGSALPAPTSFAGAFRNSRTGTWMAPSSASSPTVTRTLPTSPSAMTSTTFAKRCASFRTTAAGRWVPSWSGSPKTVSRTWNTTSRSLPMRGCSPASSRC